LNVLRYKIYTVADTDTLTSYANGIFRYSEIWLYKLYATQLSEKKNAAEVNLLLINVCNFLIDYSRLSKDLRFLNTALKILQLKKMPVLRKQLAKDLTTSQQHYYRLRIRAVLLLEHQVQQLLSGEK
jgi:beta-lactamase class D